MDITVELHQNKESFVVTLKGKNDTSIHLTLNYVQTRALAEGLLTMVNQAPIKEFIDDKYGEILGDIKVKLNLLLMDEFNKEEGEKELCRPNILPARTEEIFISRSA